MKIIIITPSAKSNAANRTILKMSNRSDVQLVAIIHRKVFGIKRLKEQLNIGMFAVLKKVFFKLIVPSINSIFKRKNGKSNLSVPQHFVSSFNDDSSIDLIKSYDVDLILFTGGGILSKEVLNSCKIGVLNCHLGLLPKYRGMHPYIWALYHNDMEAIGCTTHLMDEGIDTGPIVSRFPIKARDVEFQKLAETLEKMIPDCLNKSLDILRGDLTRLEYQRKQDGKLFRVPDKSVVDIAKANFRNLTKN